MILKSIENSNKFLINGHKEPKGYRVSLVNDKVHLVNVYTRFREHNLGTIQHIIIDGTQYDNHTAHCNR